ncbi:MAG: hypothetical protein JKX90_07290 [Colwellia sp.]|nr:hypothetical protein [Colwellia sp.]
MSESNTVDGSSPSVQTHLGIMQAVIQRMAVNSTSSKAWCITIVSAILVIVADKSKPEFAWIAIIPTFLFMCLDTYYLALEKGFRSSYNTFVKKLHEGTLLPEDLYSVLPEGNQSKHQWESLKSFSVWGFYIGLFILVALTKTIVLS